MASSKNEIKSYSRANKSLKLYDGNVFKIYAVSDIVGLDLKLHKSVISRGEYKFIENKLILEYKKPAVFTDTLYYVVWGNRIFLMNKLDITCTANILNLNQHITLSYLGWDERENEGKSAFGLPVFPEPFSSYLIMDSLSADVISTNKDSAEVTINKGKKDGLYYGCELTDGKNCLDVEYLYPDSAVLIPTGIFLFNEYYKLWGKDFIKHDSLTAMRLEEGQLLNSKYLYLPGRR